MCGHGMGPNMAAAAAKTERCAARGAVGPFPYVAGTLEVLSMPLAEELAEAENVNRFVQRAHAQNPPCAPSPAAEGLNSGAYRAAADAPRRVRAELLLPRRS